MDEVEKSEEDENKPFELGTGLDATVFDSVGTQKNYLNEFLMS